MRHAGCEGGWNCLAELVWLKEDPLLHAHGQVHTVCLFQTSLSMMVMGLIRQTKISFNIFYVTSCNSVIHAVRENDLGIDAFNHILDSEN